MLKDIVRLVIACGYVATLVAMPACMSWDAPEGSEEEEALPIPEEAEHTEPQVNSHGQCCKWHCNNPDRRYYDAGVTQNCTEYAEAWCRSRALGWRHGDAWWGRCNP